MSFVALASIYMPFDLLVGGDLDGRHGHRLATGYVHTDSRRDGIGARTTTKIRWKIIIDIV